MTYSISFEPLSSSDDQSVVRVFNRSIASVFLNGAEIEAGRHYDLSASGPVVLEATVVNAKYSIRYTKGYVEITIDK